MVDAPVLGTGAFGVGVRVSSRPLINFLREVFCKKIHGLIIFDRQFNYSDNVNYINVDFYKNDKGGNGVEVGLVFEIEAN